MKERGLHGSTVEIKTALTSHCDPGSACICLFLLKPSKIGIICVTGVQGPQLGPSQRADEMLPSPTRAAV